MRKIALSLAILGATLVPVLYTAPAHAQATRTWISGVGDDANPCSRTAPCKTFAGAISKTAAGGEIDNLDTGGFGALTITKSITLDGGGGAVASVLTSGTPGITVAAGTTDVVILRNLQFQGLLGNGSSPSGAGTTGINITSGATVNIEHVTITGFAQNGISDTRTAGGTKLFVKDTIVQNSAGTGVALAAGATNNAVLEDVHVIGNGNGVTAATGNNVIISRSVVSGNTTNGVSAVTNGQMLVDNTEVVGNGTGANSTAVGAVVFANSDIYFNTTAFAGTSWSYGNNRVLGNGSLGGSLVTPGAATNDHGQE